MIDRSRPVQEDELHAYVDGRLDPARRTEVERHIHADPALQRRVDAWGEQTRALREALAFKFHEPVPSSLHLGRLMEQRMVRRRFGLLATPWRAAAAMVLVFGIGAVAGWTVHGPRQPGEVTRLGMEAAAAHSIFGADRAHGVEIGPANQTELAAWIDSKLRRKVDVPDLSSQGYRMIGGRLLSTMIGPAAMLVYENDRGARISLYLQPMRSDVAPMVPVQAGANHGYAWIESHMGYGVICSGDSSVQGLADKLQRITTPER